ncbi:MAG TPA: acyl-CoA dehydrogenase [Actinospica sp.]|jgi:acyl-CoA oxidase|nr:acyl-CoA dehydrogenase [Actinospica sp.]
MPEALRDLVHPLVPASTTRRIRELFSDSGSGFAARRDLTREQTTRLVHEQLRTINAEFGPGSDLLAEPSRLYALFTWAGLADPALVFVMLVHYCLAQASVVELGGSTERIRELDELTSFGSFLITEPRRGSSHIATRTQATYDAARDGFVLTTPSPVAAKLANAALPGVPKLGVVLARLKIAGRDCGVFAFVVPLRDERGLKPGVEIQPLPGMPMFAADSCLVNFDHVRVPRADWLADGATIEACADGTTFHDPCADLDARLVRTIASGPYCWSAISTALSAAARGCVTIALRYASQRTTMGRTTPRLPALAHRNQHRPLLGALAEAYAITFLANESALAYTSKRTGQESLDDAAAPWSSINASSALTKALVSRGLENVAERCRRSTGALGLMTANRILDYQMLGHAFHAAGGDNQLILLDTARTLAEPPPPAEFEGGLEQGSVLDPAFHQALAEVREHRAHQQAAENPNYDTSLELANAHGAALTLAAGMRAASRSADTRLVTDLCLLHTLETTHACAGWLLANKLLTPAQALEIPEALNTLCERLLPDVNTLIDAFDIPGSLLGSPRLGST